MTSAQQENTVYDLAEIEQLALDLIHHHNASPDYINGLFACFPMVRNIMTEGFCCSWEIDDELARQAAYCLNAIKRAF